MDPASITMNIAPLSCTPSEVPGERKLARGAATVDEKFAVVNGVTDVVDAVDAVSVPEAVGVVVELPGRLVDSIPAVTHTTTVES